MLSHTAILELIETRKLVITPLLDRDLQVQAGGLDLRLGVDFVVARRFQTAAVNQLDYFVSQPPVEMHYDRVYVPLGKNLTLSVGEVVLGTTLEYVAMPLDLGGLLIDKPSRGYLGLALTKTNKISPGFNGSITIELINNGRSPVTLYPGIRIVHLILYAISGPQFGYGWYQHAIGPEFPERQEDPELRFLSEIKS